MFVFADSAGLGDAAAVELTGVGAGEEGEMGGSVVSIAAPLRRSTAIVSSRPLRRTLKVLSPRESTWHGPS